MMKKIMVRPIIDIGGGSTTISIFGEDRFMATALSLLVEIILQKIYQLF